MELPYNPKKEEEEVNVGSVVTVDVSSTSFLEDLLDIFLVVDDVDFFTDVGCFLCLLPLLFPLSPLLALLNVSTLTLSLLIVVMDADGHILDILDLLVLEIIKSDGNSTIRRIFFIFCCCCFAMFDIDDVLLSNVVSFVFVVELFPNEFLRT